MQPLRAKAGKPAGEEILTHVQIKTIFSEVETIALINDQCLLGPLRLRVSDWSDTQTVGDLFGLTFASLLKMYTFYANNYIQVRAIASSLSLRVDCAGGLSTILDCFQLHSCC